jgi:hypothetical protein
VVGEDFSRNLDFSGMLGLRELHIVLSDYYEAFGSLMPTSISQLSGLEVLQLGTAGQPRAPWLGPVWQEPVLGMSTTVLASCTSLRSLGYAHILSDVPVEVHLPHLSSLQLEVWDTLPEMINTSCCPSLQHLVVQCSEEYCPTTSLVQRLAQLTALTCLQLNSGGPYYDAYYRQTSWCGLEPLGRSLLMLRRLELVSCYGDKQRDWLAPLVMPNLSTFTQLKQLQLACGLNPKWRIPPQPSPADFLGGLSGLTQLEQVELLGYSSVTPGLMTDLVTRLPGLRALEVGLCRHPKLVQAKGQQARRARDGAGSFCGDPGELLPVHQGFAQASRACERLRPGLKVKVGYTPQWIAYATWGWSRC